MNRNTCVAISVIALLALGCTPTPQEEAGVGMSSESEAIPLSLDEANRLAVLPLKCLETEYPNKLGQVLADVDDLKAPSIWHPAFYGCFDWHSSVHGHWSLVWLLKHFEGLEHREQAEAVLRKHLTRENITKELEYFQGEHNRSFERTYGWAWLMRLAEELYTWDSDLGRELYTNLEPLTDFLASQYIAYLPKLNYPIRVGTHTNTAFGLTLAYDYAKTTSNHELSTVIEQRARDYFWKDTLGPFRWEPDGHDFLSPCLEEVDLMLRVLSEEEFEVWLRRFLPQLYDPNFDLAVGLVSDRSDGHLVHLDGLNFSRAWCLYRLAEKVKDLGHLGALADKHMRYSLPSIVDGDYAGEHWLASFALEALSKSQSLKK